MDNFVDNWIDQFDGLGGSIIKSIQRLTVEWTTTTTTIDAAINSVDINKSIVTISSNVNQTQQTKTQVAVGLINSTTVRLYRADNTFTGSQHYITIIEFNNVKSKQTGITAITSYPTNVTITNVNTLKSVVFASGTNSNATADPRRCNFVYDLTSATNLQLNSSAPDHTVYWQVIEFN